MAKDKETQDRNNNEQPTEIPVGGPEDDASQEVETGPDELTDEELLEKKFAQAEAKIEELEDQRLRALAELENYKKRMARQFDDAIRTGNDRILSELLEIADNFERALQHSDGAEGANGAVTDGTRMIYGQLKTLLERHGVTPIESVGQRFDPNLHEALLQVASDEYDEGVVAQEVTRGYMIDDRVLRHARVAVSKGPEGKTGEENQG